MGKINWKHYALMGLALGVAGWRVYEHVVQLGTPMTTAGWVQTGTALVVVAVAIFTKSPQDVAQAIGDGVAATPDANGQQPPAAS